MQMTPIESSTVKTIGYDPDVLVLAVRYRDGSMYVFCDVSADQYAALMCAPSKGSWLHQNLGASGKRVEKEVTRKEEGPERRGAGSVPAPLNVIDQEADACCVRSLTRIFALPITMASFQRSDPVGAITACGDCGQEFRCERPKSGYYGFIPTQLPKSGYWFWRCIPSFCVVRK